MKNMASQGNKRAKLTLKLSDDYDKLISAILIGNNIVNITSSVLSTVLFVGLFGSAGVSIATLVMTVLLIFIAEITPKTLAKEAPEPLAMFAAPILNCLIFILSPVNRLLILWKQTLLKLLKFQAKKGVTEDELLTFVEEVRQEGGINEGEEDMIRRTIAFDDRIAQVIYTPRIDVVAVSVADSVEKVNETFHKSGYSRLPVYKDNIDTIVGFVLLKDFYHKVIENKQSVESIIKPAVFITKSMKLSKLLKKLQEKKCHQIGRAHV
jgi:CBS domain containing-hemolysin-like protein